MKYLSFAGLGFFLFLLIPACQVEPQHKVIINTSNSPFYITKDTTIRKEDTLIISSGAVVYINDHVNIQVQGILKIKGSPKNKAQIKPINPGVGWGEFRIEDDVDSLIVENAIIEDGRFRSFNSVNEFRNVTFRNKQNLPLNHNDGAIARFFSGKLIVDQCAIYGNNKGEGILCHDLDSPIVVNSYFKSIPDAVEYLNCKGGRIGNCQFFDIHDDAIDLNHCSGTLIDSNLLVNINDRGMEIGSDNFGSSTDILVYRNILSHCKTGINFKEGSTGLIQNNTIVNNEKGVSSLSTGRPNLGSTVKIVNCIFDENAIPVFKDSASAISVIYSSSSTVILKGEGNLLTNPLFVSKTNMDFHLNKDSECIDRGIDNGITDPDQTILDMGAIHYHQSPL